MKKPGLLLSLLPVVILIAIIAIGVKLFEADITSGPSQVALLFAPLEGRSLPCSTLKFLGKNLRPA